MYKLRLGAKEPVWVKHIIHEGEQEHPIEFLTKPYHQAFNEALSARVEAIEPKPEHRIITLVRDACEHYILGVKGIILPPEVKGSIEPDNYDWKTLYGVAIQDQRLLNGILDVYKEDSQKNAIPLQVAKPATQKRTTSKKKSI